MEPVNIGLSNPIAIMLFGSASHHFDHRRQPGQAGGGGPAHQETRP